MDSIERNRNDNNTTTLPKRFRKVLNAYQSRNNNCYANDAIFDKNLLFSNYIDRSLINRTDTRYYTVLSKGRNSCDKGGRLYCEQEIDVKDDSVDEIGECTEDDISKGIKWIKEQILLMKEEDKMLLQQFLDLRARIRNVQHHITLRRVTDLSDSIVNEPSSSHLGINETSNNTIPIDLKLSPNTEEDYLGEFRERTVSLVGRPEKKVTLFPSMTKRKYRTEEYL